MKIVAAQLDLARQPETVERVCSFIGFIRAQGYNTLFLYLEGRIRTKSFSGFPVRESYSPEDIRTIVDHATQRKIDVIPAVPCLGHTEHFLETKAGRHLEEEQDVNTGRWLNRGRGGMTCPSDPETVKFFSRYYREVARLFPSKYFHVGMDESWHIGYCDRCNERFQKAGRGDEIFAEFLTTVHGVLKKLGKTMMMWDDMFEVYPAALEPLPRDIVMCTWNYGYFVRQPLGHFFAQRREDPFREYDRLGFKYLLCPAARAIPNIRSFTEYAERYSPLGGIVTLWERSRSFLDDAFPVFAYAGRLWTRDAGEAIDDEELVDEVFSDLFDVDSPRDLLALKSYYYTFSPRGMWTVRPDCIRGLPVAEDEMAYRGILNLQSQLKALNCDGKAIRKDMLSLLDEAVVRYRMRVAVARRAERRFDGCEPPPVDFLVEELRAVQAERHKRWKKLRRGIPHKKMDAWFDATERDLREAAHNIDEADGLLHLELFLPDAYSAPFMDLVLTLEDGTEAPLLGKASLKPLPSPVPYYEVVLPYKGGAAPTSVSLSVRGYGGQGVSYLKVRTAEGAFRPVSIGPVDGTVQSPGHLLRDDLSWSWFGEHDASRGFRWNDYKSIAHGLVVNLASAEKDDRE